MVRDLLYIGEGVEQRFDVKARKKNFLGI